MSDNALYSGSYLKIMETPEAWPELPALAARLGVQPNIYKGSGRTVLSMKNGDKYDLFDLVNAFLDRIDGVSK